ncbi:MAG: hypothetical protein Q9218_007864 [Villophora microphyllina]
MGRELQKKKNRSSIPKVKHKRKNQHTKKLQVKGNAIVVANWNRKETLSQNYRRLGLISKINSRAGGIEVNPSTLRHANKEENDTLAIKNANTTTLIPGTARIERDPETGAILRVIRDNVGQEDGVRRWGGRELRDLFRDEDEEDENRAIDLQHNLPTSSGMPSTKDLRGIEGIVPELLSQAETTGMRKRPRKQSKREEEWIKALVEKYGDDVRGMVRDRKLNPMQQSEGDIGRRIKAWKKGRRKIADDEDDEDVEA